MGRTVGFPKLYLPAVTSAIVDEDGRKLVINKSDGTISIIDTNSLVDTKMATTSYRSQRNGTFSRVENRPKVEKRYTMPADKFSLVDFTDLGCVDEDMSMMPKFVVGENYALGGEVIEGYTQKRKVYKLIGVVDTFAGANVDSLIVKQIEGEQSHIYTISKNDCAFLGIEYQNGLQLFSKDLGWKHVRNLPEFNPHNMSTSPTSEIDNSIRHMVLKLNGFTDYADGYVLSPSGKLIKENQFVQSVQVIAKEPVVYGNGHIVQDKVPLRVSVTHPRSKLFNHGNFISSEDEVFLLIELVDWKSHLNANTFDGKFGVDPKYFDGLDPNKYLEVSWDELGGLTVEEYEENKRKAAEEAERAAKAAEEERKRLIAEAEKAEAEKRRLEALAIERMKRFQLREHQLQAIPVCKADIDPIVGIGVYLDSLNDYFSNIDNMVSDLTEDISKIKRELPVSPVSHTDMWGNAYRQGMVSANQLSRFLDERF